MTARALMFQGTGSDVGKSLLAAGFCRALVRRGLSVRPFKPQNMSNNAAVTGAGGEIGRAQALQARACGVAPESDMNPVLLKPQSDVGAQLVVHGRVVGNYAARDYADLKGELIGAVRESFQRLTASADFVVVEGAGSPAEVNLRKGDIANMGFALDREIPVVLIADVERGGALAAIVGTWTLLDDDERALLAGYVVNKFRGDLRLFDDAIDIIGARTGLRCFGILPHLAAAARLPAEDTMALDTTRESGARAIRVAVPRLAHIANFDDLDPLRAEADVAVEIVPPGRALPGDADLIVLPGSKTTLADLADLRAQGWDVDIAAHLRRGGHVLGICGGFQMMGCAVADPDGIEGRPGEADGLGLLDVETTLGGDKALSEVAGEAFAGLGPARGYEMHVGRTAGTDCARPFLAFDGGRTDGAVSADGRAAGCYVHGLFADDRFRAAYLGRLRAREGSGVDYEAGVEAALDEVASAMETALDVDAMIAAAGA